MTEKEKVAEKKRKQKAEALEQADLSMSWYLTAFKKAYESTGDINLAIRLANGYMASVTHKPDEIDQQDKQELNIQNYEVDGFKV